MGLLLTTVVGLVIWVVLWAVGAKGFDAFMVTALLIVVAATARMMAPFLPGNRED
jgi:hypothetical protein